MLVQHQQLPDPTEALEEIRAILAENPELLPMVEGRVQLEALPAATCVDGSDA